MGSVKVHVNGNVVADVNLVVVILVKTLALEALIKVVPVLVNIN